MWTTNPRSKIYSFLDHYPHPGSHTQNLSDPKVLGQHHAAKETQGLFSRMEFLTQTVGFQVLSGAWPSCSVGVT